jgi:hypothetical protein
MFWDSLIFFEECETEIFFFLFCENIYVTTSLSATTTDPLKIEHEIFRERRV